ncbi:hypothetical protein D3C85_1152640 [compost metagenome]
MRFRILLQLARFWWPTRFKNFIDTLRPNYLGLPPHLPNIKRLLRHRERMNRLATLFQHPADHRHQSDRGEVSVCILACRGFARQKLVQRIRIGHPRRQI